MAKNKLEIDQYIYRLVQNYNNLNEQKEKLSDIGNFSGIEKELDNLKKQKENISRELSLSEEDIQKYDKAIGIVSQIEVQIKKLKEEIQKIEMIKSVVEPVEVYDFFSEKTRDLINDSIKNVIESADHIWLTEQTKIIAELKTQVSKIEKLQTEQQDIINVLSPKIADNESIKKLTEAIQSEEKKKIEFQAVVSMIKTERRGIRFQFRSISKFFH